MTCGGTCSPRSLRVVRYPPPGTLDRAAEHVAGDERQDDGIPAHRGVQAVLGDEVEQPGSTALASQSSLPGGLTASGHPGGTYPYVSRSTMWQ